jgi:dolichol kinase
VDYIHRWRGLTDEYRQIREIAHFLFSSFPSLPCTTNRNIAPIFLFHAIAAYLLRCLRLAAAIAQITAMLSPATAVCSRHRHRMPHPHHHRV